MLGSTQTGECRISRVFKAQIGPDRQRSSFAGARLQRQPQARVLACTQSALAGGPGSWLGVRPAGGAARGHHTGLQGAGQTAQDARDNALGLERGLPGRLQGRARTNAYF